MQVMEKPYSEFMYRLRNGENYIFGAGALGKEIYRILTRNSIAVNAFIDNHPKSDDFCGLPIVAFSDISDKNVNVIVASITYMYDIENQLKSNNYTNVIPFAVMTKIFSELKYFNPAYNGLQEDYENHKNDYEKLYDYFEDDESKEVLNTIIKYRKTLDTAVYNKIKHPETNQYFEDFLPVCPVFVDGGAFDGQNTMDYISRFPHYEKVYLFEPDDKSMERTKLKLSGLGNIEYYNCGISDRAKILRFDSRHDLGSLITESGNTEIKCISLDEIVSEDKAYIKLDIEGAELDAINGAERLISNGSPLAVCVYHKPEDIRVIPARIKELYPGYKFKLRHYTSSIFESVLYAIP